MIQKRSPHLLGALKRNFRAPDAALLEEAFSLAMEIGGENELDFTRAKEASFNPRPARVALILLQEMKVREVATLAAAILASTHPRPNQEELQELFETRISNDNQIRQEIIRLYSQISGPLEKTLAPDEVEQSAAVIVLALLLDRARHLHLAKGDDAKIRQRDFLDSLPQYLKLAQRVNRQVYTLLEAWNTRATQSRFAS
jgi:hypothetical protein